MLKSVLICFAIFTYFLGDATQARASCPIRPASDIRGPPGIPGRNGEPGKFKNILTKNCLDNFAYGCTEQQNLLFVSDRT